MFFNKFKLKYKEAESIKDLDSLPYADFSDYDFSKYHLVNTLPMITSRGCPNKCIFCNERVFFGKYRSMSAQRVYAEIEFQLSKRPTIDHVYFYDSLINANIEQLSILMDLFINGDLNVKWSVNAVLRKEMDLKLFSKMKEAGCSWLAFGLENASVPLMLKVGKQTAKNIDLDKIIRECSVAGIKCTLNFMFGLPGETESDFAENIKLLERNKDYITEITLSHSFCTLSPGSSAYDQADKYGIDLKCEDLILGLDINNGHNYWKMKDPPNDYLIRLNRYEQLYEAAAINEITCRGIDIAQKKKKWVAAYLLSQDVYYTKIIKFWFMLKLENEIKQTISVMRYFKRN